MNNYKLLINSLEIELNDNFSIALTKKNFMFSEVKDFQANLTTNFEIPKTAKNKIALNFPTAINSNTMISIQNVYLYSGSILLIENGTAIISDNGLSFSAAVYFGNYNLLKQLSEIKLSDVSEYFGSDTLDLAKVQVTELQDVMLPVICTNKSGFIIDDTGKVNINQFLPHFRVNKLIDSLLTKYNINLDFSDYISDEFFISGRKVSQIDAFEKQTYQLFDDYSLGRIDGSIYNHNARFVSNTQNNYWFRFNEIIGITNEQIKNYQNYTVFNLENNLKKFQLFFEFSLEKIIMPFELDNIEFSLLVRMEADGNILTVGSKTFTNIAFENLTDVYNCYFETNSLSYTDYSFLVTFEFFANKKGTTDNWEGRLTLRFNPENTKIIVNSIPAISYPIVINDFSNLLPDISFLELTKIICQKYCLTPLINSDATGFTFSTLAELKQTEAIELTSKIDMSKPIVISRKIADFGEKSRIMFDKNNIADKCYFDILINNKNYKTEAEILKFIDKYPIVKYVYHVGANTLIDGIYDTPNNSFKEFPIYINNLVYNPTPTPTATQFTIGTNNANIVSFFSCDQFGTNLELKQIVLNYLDFAEIIQLSFVIDCYVYLTETEFKDFDINNLYYTQIGENTGNYFVEILDNFIKNQSTKCKLIKI